MICDVTAGVVSSRCSPFLGVHLDGEAAHVTHRLRRAALVHDGREAHRQLRALAHLSIKTHPLEHLLSSNMCRHCTPTAAIAHLLQPCISSVPGHSLC